MTIRPPKGGTEILEENLRKYFKPEDYGVNLMKSNCNMAYLDYGKKNVLWQHNNNDNLHGWAGMFDPIYLANIDAFVYVSHWLQEKVRMGFPPHDVDTFVIRNATDAVEFKPRPKGEKIKLIYTSTPWRGLDILLDSFSLLKRDDVELHVYSSTKIYGSEFERQEEDTYAPLFKKAEEMENVVYKGFASNEEVRSAVKDAHIFAYPSIFAETSCLAMIEAGIAGCNLNVSSLGALPETGMGFPKFSIITQERQDFVKNFADDLNETIDNYWTVENQEKIKKQSQRFNEIYSWDVVKHDWERLFNRLSS